MEIKPEIDQCSCNGVFEFDSYCAVKVCDQCGDHKGLSNCWCGWSKGGGNGRQELEEAGETIESEPEYGGGG